jgi:hypothetical protein
MNHCHCLKCGQRLGKPPVRHPEAVAYDRFAASNADSFNARTLGTNTPDYYLGNRLRAAFHAGWEAAERHHAEMQKK